MRSVPPACVRFVLFGRNTYNDCINLLRTFSQKDNVCIKSIIIASIIENMYICIYLLSPYVKVLTTNHSILAFVKSYTYLSIL